MSTTSSPQDLKMALTVCDRRAHRYYLPESFVADANAQMFWLLQILYKCTIGLTKTSILLLYLRIFPQKRFRCWVYGAMVFVIGYAFASIVATITQCHPIKRAFNHNLDGGCINLTWFWYCNAAASIFSDCLILALPMPLIASLHLPRRQKYGLMMVFALGGL